MNIADSVAEWLLGRENVIAAVPVTVQIGRRTYTAVKYTESERGVEEARLYVWENCRRCTARGGFVIGPTPNTIGPDRLVQTTSHLCRVGRGSFRSAAVTSSWWNGRRLRIGLRIKLNGFRIAESR